MPYCILFSRRRAAEQGRRRREESERRQRELADDLEAQRAAEEAEKEVKTAEINKKITPYLVTKTEYLPYFIAKFKIKCLLASRLSIAFS